MPLDSDAQSCQLRGYRILLALYVPVAFRPFLQGFDTKFTTGAVRTKATRSVRGGDSHNAQDKIRPL